MKHITFNRGIIFRIFLVLALVAGMASFPGQGARAAIDAASFAAKVDFGTGTSPFRFAIGDLDGDGKPDLAVANANGGSVSVLRNTSTSGSLSFDAKVDFNTGTSPYTVAIGDLDGDGKPDLAVANLNSSTVSVLRNTSTSGSVAFAAKVDFGTGGGPTSVAIGDLDGDGKPDLAVANYNGNTISQLLNTSTSGSVSFAAKVDFSTGTNPYDVAISDLDGDGKPDLAVMNYNEDTVSVLRNTSTSGSVAFAPKVDFGTGSHAHNVVIGDLDGDGKPDLAVANYASDTISLLRNTSTSGSISFAAKVDFGTGNNPYYVAIGDLDGDGKPDLAAANWTSNNVSVLRNTSTSGNVSFAAKVNFSAGNNPASVAIGDLDGDGKPDLAVANWNSDSVSVLRNTQLPSTFADVPTDQWYYSWVERLYAAGITSGCGTNPLFYCPDDSVTRAQMAKFIEKGINGSAYTPPAGTGMVFADVPLSYWADNWIEKFYADGITSGCILSPLTYCPDNLVTRAQMAIFLLRARHGHAYTPPAVGGSTGFNDVSTSYWDAAWIKQLAAEAITSGCGSGNYCPEDPVTRAQMAKFLVLTFNLP